MFRFIKSFSIYTGSLALDKAIGFLLLPFITAAVSETDMGKYALLTVMINVAITVITLQVRAPLISEFFKLSRADYKVYFSSALSNTLWAFLLGLGVCALISGWLSTRYDVPALWIMALPILAMLSLLPLAAQTIWQMGKRPLPYGIFTVSGTLFRLLLTLVLVLGLGWSYEGLLWGLLITGIAQSIWAGYALYSEGYLHWEKPNKAFRQDALRMGIPLIPHVLGAMILESSDRFFIEAMVSKEAVGVYSVGYTVGGIIMFVQHAFTQTWNPIAFQRLNDLTEHNRYAIVSISYTYWLMLIAMALGLWVFSPLIFYFLNERYAAGIIYVPWVALGCAFLGAYKSATVVIFYLKRTAILTWVSLVNVIVTFALNYILISKYGTIGAAYATTLSYGLFFIIIFIISYRLFPLPWFDFKGLYNWGRNRRFFKKRQL